MTTTLCQAQAPSVDISMSDAPNPMARSPRAPGVQPGALMLFVCQQLTV